MGFWGGLGSAVLAVAGLIVALVLIVTLHELARIWLWSLRRPPN